MGLFHQKRKLCIVSQWSVIRRMRYINPDRPRAFPSNPRSKRNAIENGLVSPK